MLIRSWEFYENSPYRPQVVGSLLSVSLTEGTPRHQKPEFPGLLLAEAILVQDDPGQDHLSHHAEDDDQDVKAAKV